MKINEGCFRAAYFLFSLKNNLKFISIDQKYLKYLHDFCKEVYWQPVGYETKPYLGILVEDKGNEYVIPLSSAKEKHKSWKNVDIDRFLIFENCEKSEKALNGIYTENNWQNREILLRF